MFTERGLTPYFICFLAMWSSVILIVKRLKLGMQQKTIAIAILPETEDFTLSVSTVDQLFERIGMVVDSPSHFVLFRRIHIALSNLRNLGRVTDVDAMLKSQAEHDESTMETSYSIIRGFVWAIPVLGFIGTVIGLSQAIGGFGEVVGNGGDINDITSSLSVVTAGLSTAFETTLLALVFALIIQLAMTFLKKSEEEFLDDCEEYCQKHIVNRLRIMPFEQEVHESA
ncbi:MAG: hypothetical protein COA78_12935 [Blastopirellula sp.]|nr:MAG: hypothetical protein COA78_12935 [Blastopirellula sp.]